MNEAAIYEHEILPLSEREERLLAELEGHIQEHLRGFKIVGKALATIRDKRLYRIDHETFEDYCAEKWDISRRRAYQLADCYEVVNNLCTMVHIDDEPKFSIVPNNERQARPLTIIPMEQQGEVWSMILEESEKQARPITGAFVQMCIDTWRQKKVTTRLTSSTNRTPSVALPELLALSFKTFVDEIKTNSSVLADQRCKRELVGMLREILEALED